MIEGSANPKVVSKLRYGMVGGGKGAFIGDVHRKSIALDGLAELVAGSFSQNFENTLETGASLGLSRDRLYATYEEMAEKEAARPDGIDFVSIVTPNALHYPVAKAFLNAGIHVVCDKPLTFEEAEARELGELAKKKGLFFGVTYTYTGYPAVKHAREMVRRGDIGEIRFVNAEYPQEWLATPSEREGSKQASWRTNPALAGKSNCVGDIGSHVENMVSYVTGLKIKSLCARSTPSSREDCSTTMLPSWSSTRVVQRDCIGRARLRSATTMVFALGSLAPRERSSGRRRTRTISWSRSWASRQ